MKLCLRQWIRPKGPYINIEGVGDCRICTQHNDNKYCKCYYPITVTTYEVKENKNADI